MNIKPQEITIDPNNPYDGNRLFRNEQAAKALTQIVKHTQMGKPHLSRCGMSSYKRKGTKLSISMRGKVILSQTQ